MNHWKIVNHWTSILIAWLLAASVTMGHGNGRLFDIAVVDGKLVAQGYNTGGFDGLDSIRPYFNSIHDHFNFIGTETHPLGVTNYPSWDIGVLPAADISPLIGYELSIELVGSGKWVNIPPQDGTGAAQDFGAPELVQFDPEHLQVHPSELIRIRFGNKMINTLQLGEFQFSPSVAGVMVDLDFEYFIDNHNAEEIYFLQWKLKTNAPGVEDSETIFVIQSPDGFGPEARLHFQSLYLEQYLGTERPSAGMPGDVNRDGRINLLDVAPFAALIDTGGFQPEADVNQDGAVDLLDVQPFVKLLIP